MAEIGRPPFGYVFDPDELAKQYHQGMPDKKLARIGMPDVSSDEVMSQPVRSSLIPR